MTNPVARLKGLIVELSNTKLVKDNTVDNESLEEFEQILVKSKPFDDEKDFYDSVYEMLHNKDTITATRLTVKTNCPALLLWMGPLEILYYFEIQKLVHIKVNGDFDYTLDKFQFKPKPKTNNDNKLKNLENELKLLKAQMGREDKDSLNKRKNKERKYVPRDKKENESLVDASWAKMAEEN